MCPGKHLSGCTSFGIGSVWINQLRTLCDDPEVRALLDEFEILPIMSYTEWLLWDIRQTRPKKEIHKNRRDPDYQIKNRQEILQMRFIIQRVSEASVTVEDQTIGKIQKGFLVLIGVSDSDTQETADKLIKK